MSLKILSTSGGDYKCTTGKTNKVAKNNELENDRLEMMDKIFPEHRVWKMKDWKMTDRTKFLSGRL